MITKTGLDRISAWSLARAKRQREWEAQRIAQKHTRLARLDAEISRCPMCDARVLGGHQCRRAR